MAQERHDHHALMEGGDHKSTGLFDLPAELWSKIGKIVIDDTLFLAQNLLGATPPRTVTRSTLHHGRERDIDCSVYLQPPITRTCSSLRNELLPYYYATKVAITLTRWDVLLVNVGKWLRAIGPVNRSNVRGLTIESFSQCIFGSMCAGGGGVSGSGGLLSIVESEWRCRKDEITIARELEREWRIEVTVDFESKVIHPTGDVYRIKMG